MKKLVLFITIATLISISSAHAQSNFRDVPDNHWAAQAVKRLAEAGIIEGRPLSEAPKSSTRTQKRLTAIKTTKQKTVAPK